MAHSAGIGTPVALGAHVRINTRNVEFIAKNNHKSMIYKRRLTIGSCNKTVALCHVRLNRAVSIERDLFMHKKVFICPPVIFT